MNRIKFINYFTEKEQHCVSRKKYTIKECRKMYPFNCASTVKLIAFDNKNLYTETVPGDRIEEDVLFINDTVFEVIRRELPPLEKVEKETNIRPVPLLSYHDILIVEDTFLIQKPKESIELIDNQQDSLAYLLFNYQFNSRKVPKSYSETGFHPNNTIVFLDAKNKPFAYLEISFSEKNYVEFPYIFSGYFCTEKYELLKNFFRKAGIRYGTD